MENIGVFYKNLYTFLDREVHKLLDQERLVAIEIPITKKMYYCIIEIFHDGVLGIMLFEGNQGLNTIKQRLDEDIRTVDLSQRSQYIGIGFENEIDPGDEETFRDDLFNNFDGRGYPVMYYKAKGFMSQDLREEQLEDMIQVFEALNSVALKNIKAVKALHEGRKLTTVFKEANQWVVEERKVTFAYEQVKFSPLVIESLVQKTSLSEDSWYITSIYHGAPVEMDTSVMGLEVKVYPGKVSIYQSANESIASKKILGAKTEVQALEEVIIESLELTKLRPKKIITDLPVVYYGCKDFLEALKVQLIYKPKNSVLKKIVEKFYPEEILDSDDYLNQEVFYHFLKIKGYTIEVFDALEQQKIDQIMVEYDKMRVAVEKAFDEHMRAHALEDLLDEVSEKALLEYAMAFIKGKYNEIYKFKEKK